MKKYLIFFLLVIYGASLFAQSDIKIMSYNLLIYPEGEMVNRIDTLSKILDFYEPDLLLVQELKSEQGLQSIAEELSALFGDYKAGTYVPQVSNPANSWRLQQNLIFNEAIFELVSEEAIETPYRDVNYFQLRILEEDGTPSTELLHTYVTHLKSSQGSTNEQLRLSMVEVLNNHISLLPPESNIIVAGDFNVYYGGEPAYESLLSPNGTNTLHDPIDMPGWAGTNFPNQEIFTQSTRLSSLADGSGGGVDDRFDFILLSEQLMNPNARYVYQADSYKALGNNGTCYNQDLIDCSTVDNVPFDLLRALYHMSDHLPIVLSLDINEAVSTIELPFSSESQLIEIAPNPANAQADLVWHGTGPVDLRIFNLQGKLILAQNGLEQKATIDIAHLPLGLYMVQMTDKDAGVREAAKMLIQR
ncbi:MAG: T9SS type A sorting domain-containing protein [Lewinella sp.]|uniref:T9SS type A sorting domain-containing protein n=1 Tax=Lewinella sp. TaxID=2004506 RepID=UPI003D6BF133